MTRANSKGMSGHHSARSASEEWYTPPEIIDALGGADSFDLDPCAPAVQPFPTARRTYTIAENGLLQPWDPDDRLWVNPPFTMPALGLFLGKLRAHGGGIALTFARTDTTWFVEHLWGRAGMLFLFGREHFIRPDGTPAKANCGGPLVLSAFGRRDVELLGDCALAGQFIPIGLPRMVQVATLDATWREIIRQAFADHGDELRLTDLYAALARHPKTRRNPRNWKPKLRQVLQRGAGRRVAPGVWRAA